MSERADRIGDFTIGPMIGRGTMGVVHEATSPDGQTVAVKLLHPQVATDDAVIASFVRERQLLGGLTNENIVDVHDLLIETDQLGVVMEYANSGDLRQLCEDKNLPPMRAIKIAVAVASGLGAIHEAGIIHRDLKPANILLHRDEADGELVPKIADFGLSRLVGGSATKLSSIAGTALYISPEAVSRDRVGSAADVYALGAILFEMLNGEPPFPGHDPMPIMLAHQQTPAPRLIGFTPELVDLVDSMLAKDPGRRPSAAEVRQSLLRYESDADVTQVRDLRSGPPSIDELDLTVRRSPPAPVDPAAAFAAPAAASSLTTVLQPGEPIAPAAPVLPAPQPPRMRLVPIAAGVGVLLALVVVAAGVFAFGPWRGEEPVASPISHSFAPQVFEDGLVAMRQWRLDPEADELHVSLALYNSNPSVLATGTYFEAVAPLLGASAATVRFAPDPSEWDSAASVARFDVVDLGPEETKELSYTIGGFEQAETLADLETLALQQVNAEQGLYEEADEDVPERSETELVAISFSTDVIRADVGETLLPLRLAGEMSDGTAAASAILQLASFRAEDPAIAWLTGDRLVPSSPGTTTVRAVVGDLQASATVIITGSDDPDGVEVVAAPARQPGGGQGEPTPNEPTQEGDIESEQDEEEPEPDDGLNEDGETVTGPTGLTWSDPVVSVDGDVAVISFTTSRCAVVSFAGVTASTTLPWFATAASATCQVDHRRSFGGLPSGTHTIRTRLREGGQVYDGPTATFTIGSVPPPGDSGSVPNLVGMPRGEAESALLSAGFANVAIAEEYSSSVPIGQVLAQDPAAEAAVALLDRVTLTVSLGPSGPVPASPDVNGDGVVDKTDFLLVSEDVGLMPSDPSQPGARSDINGDGAVTANDMALVAKAMREQDGGTTSTSTTTTDPTTTDPTTTQPTVTAPTVTLPTVTLPSSPPTSGTTP